VFVVVIIVMTAVAIWLNVGPVASSAPVGRPAGPFQVRHLFSMDIARSSLFPGLDGYAQSPGVYHSAYRPTNWTGEAERVYIARITASEQPSRRLQPMARKARRVRRD
jgi:hypothetical protein